MAAAATSLFRRSLAGPRDSPSPSRLVARLIGRRTLALQASQASSCCCCCCYCAAIHAHLPSARTSPYADPLHGSPRHEGLRLGISPNRASLRANAIRNPSFSHLFSTSSKVRTEKKTSDGLSQSNSGPPPPKSRISQRIEAARERTKVVTTRVRSSLTNLTPHENIWNLPNLLTVSRLAAAPLTAYLLLHDQHKWAFALFAYAGITDLVDGWVARRWKLQTVAGSVIDPMADKALMIILTVTLAVKTTIPLYLAILILGRDAALALAAIYYRFASLPAPKTMKRYWDFSLPSAEVHPTTVSKYNTFLQLILIGSTLALPVVTADNHHLGVLHDLGLGGLDLHQAIMYLQWLVAGTTAWSGLSYAFNEKAVTILGSNEELKRKQGARGRAIIGVTFGAVVLASSIMAFTADDNKSETLSQEDLLSHIE